LRWPVSVAFPSNSPFATKSFTAVTTIATATTTTVTTITTFSVL
jgi:hypothetical protein